MKVLARYVKGYTKEVLLAPLFKLLEACFELLVPLLIAATVDTIIPRGNQGDLVAILFLLVGLAAVGIVVSLTAQYFSAKAAVGITEGLTVDLYKKILSLPKKSRDKLSADSLLTRLGSDSLQIQAGINIFLRLFLRAPIIVFGALVLAYWVSPSLSFYFVGMVALLFLLVAGLSVYTNRYWLRLREQLDRLVGQVRKTMTGLRPMRAFDQSQAETTVFSSENQSYQTGQLQAGFLAALLSPLTFLVVNGTLLLLLWQGNQQVLLGGLERGQLLALVNYLLQILVELVKLVMVISQLNQTLIACKRVEEVFALAGEDVWADLPRLITEEEEEHIRVSHLSFTYPRAAQPALSELHFQVKRGSFLGIIGGTGSGKTSLVQLLAGFYPLPPEQLSLFKQGQSPQNLHDWRQQYSLVAQESQLLAGSIASNLSLGLGEVSESEMWQALELAQAAAFVREKGGLEAVVAPFGRNFSGGQRQRLALARAFLRKADLLILDDATSALDYLTESRIIAGLRSNTHGQTLVMVSQRTASLQAADQIVVLDQGRQVGLGSHQELLETSPLYREIHQSQERGEEER